MKTKKFFGISIVIIILLVYYSGFRISQNGFVRNIPLRKINGLSVKFWKGIDDKGKIGDFIAPKQIVDKFVYKDGHVVGKVVRIEKRYCCRDYYLTIKSLSSKQKSEYVSK
jgi:hypothetical protein